MDNQKLNAAQEPALEQANVRGSSFTADDMLEFAVWVQHLDYDMYGSGTWYYKVGSRVILERDELLDYWLKNCR